MVLLILFGVAILIPLVMVGVMFWLQEEIEPIMGSIIKIEFHL